MADSDLDSAQAAGLSEADIVETVGNVVVNIFTNYLNHVADTDIDVPVVTVAKAAARTAPVGSGRVTRGRYLFRPERAGPLRTRERNRFHGSAAVRLGAPPASDGRGGKHAPATPCRDLETIENVIAHMSELRVGEQMLLLKSMRDRDAVASVVVAKEECWRRHGLDHRASLTEIMEGRRAAGH